MRDDSGMTLKSQVRKIYSDLVDEAGPEMANKLKAKADYVISKVTFEVAAFDAGRQGRFGVNFDTSKFEDRVRNLIFEYFNGSRD